MIAKLPALEEMAKRTAEIALDEYLYQGKSIREWVKIITEQESCEDCISREAVHDLMAAWLSDYLLDETREVLETIDAKIEDLPSITPQSKMGKWIDDKCSICGKEIEDLIDSPEWYENEEPNFCPFCGVRIEKEAEE